MLINGLIIALTVGFLQPLIGTPRFSQSTAETYQSTANMPVYNITTQGDRIDTVMAVQVVRFWTEGLNITNYLQPVFSQTVCY